MRRAPLFLAMILPAPSWLRAAEPIDFNRDIRPIFSETCFQCHGPDEKARKADLRMDLPEDAYKERDGIVPIVPGNLQKSDAWTRIISEDKDEMMPPPKSHLTLSKDDKAKVKAWIEQGAKYAGHWAFIPPQKAALPGGEAGHPIDAFIRARLAKEGLPPAPEADRAMLIRRASLDLTGLPPSAEEVAAFAADPAADAYGRLIERLLASPHFGERLALEWLDAARYADTNGYSIDGGRHVWLWRDYVINAFNTNKPYDQFLLEQIAGDLLPGRTEEQLIATGFQRNNMVTHEGGTIAEENLTNYNVDRVKTLGEAVLGLTLACAQCHDHKFDPITQRDYFQLYAYFNALSDKGLDGNGGVNPGPFTQARTVLRTGEEDALRREIAQLRERLAQPAAEAVAAWEKEQRAGLARRGREFAALPVELLKVSTPNKGEGFEIDGGRFVKITKAPDMAAYDVLLKLPKTDRPITGLRAVFHPAADAPGGGWGYGPAAKRGRGQPAEKPADFKGSFVLSAISCSADAVPGDQVNLYKLLDLRAVTANSWTEKFPPADVLDLRNENGWAPDLAHDGPARFTAMFAEPLNARDTPFVNVQLNFGHGQSLVAARVELLAIAGEDDDSALPPAIIAALESGAGAPSPQGEKSAAGAPLLREYFAAHAPATARTRVALANLEERLAVLTQPFPAMVMDAAAKPRETFILNRGDYAQPTVKVSAGTPAFLPANPDGASDRRALARWITMRENPLPARVAVNRFWQMLFGAGLVRTAADFGAQGEWPSHPELLDWLAVDFIESGWDVKALVRKTVLSQTYRQTSAATPALLERDPQNRLLARGPRFRLPAEFIRDAALKTSGLLVPRIGGPSVNPYTPGDPWREVSHYGSTPATAQTFVQNHGEKLYRRSLYTFWKRTMPPANMAAFDAPNRETCVVSRPATNTPLQALVLLNDVQFVEAARAFAARILAAPGDDAAKLRWAFAEATARPPRDPEAGILAAALRRERARYAAQPKAALAYLGAGESPRDPRLAPAEHAAWSQIAATLLNLSETVTRN